MSIDDSTTGIQTEFDGGTFAVTGPDGTAIPAGAVRAVLEGLAASCGMQVLPRFPGGDPHNGKPVFGHPQYRPQQPIDDMYGDPGLTEPTRVGWDLSGGARINYGYLADDTPGGQLAATLSISDYATATGIVQRLVTREQLAQHGMHLLRLAGAEIAVVATMTVGGDGYGLGSAILAPTPHTGQ